MHNSTNAHAFSQELLNKHQNLLIWGANTHSYFLVRFCELRSIRHIVVDRSPEKRQSLFHSTQVYSTQDIDALDADSYSVVICADELRFASEIKKTAMQAGFTKIKLLREVKNELIDLIKLPLPNWANGIGKKPLRRETRKTLIVLPQFAVGGAETQALVLAKALKQQGGDCRLMSLSSSQMNCADYIRLIESSGVEWSNLPDMANPTVNYVDRCPDEQFEWLYLNTSTTHLHRLNELFIYLHEHVFDRVISFLDDANILSGVVVSSLDSTVGILSLRSMAPHHLTNEESPQPFVFELETMKALYQRLLERDQIQCYANSTKGRDSYAAWLEIDSSDISVIHNAIDCEEGPYQGFQRAVQRNKQRIEIVGVMRLEAVKGPDDFIRVLRALADMGTDFHATLVGDGSMRRQLEIMRNTFGLKDRLTFAGEQTTPLHFYINADILLHTSRVEGLPNVLMEAQLSGCHVVCTNAGSSIEALHYCYHPFVSDIGDVANLANNVVRLIETSGANRLPKFATVRNWVEERFSTSLMSQKIERLIARSNAGAPQE